MEKPAKRRIQYIVLAISFLTTGIVLLFAVRSSATKALEIVSSDPNVQVSLSHTVGTNHVYFYRDSLGKVVDSLTSQFTSRPQHALDWSTNAPSTVIWMHCSDPWFTLNSPRIAPAELLHGTLTDAEGHAVPVKPLRCALMHFGKGFYVTGWVLPGDLKAHRQSRLQIKSTNGAEVVTIQVR